MTESPEGVSFFKKWAMRQYWRMQQSQAVVSLLLWGTTITLLVWPLINWRFTAECSAGPCFPSEFFGISSTYFALTVIFFTVMFAVLTIGFLYDQVFFAGPSIGMSIWSATLLQHMPLLQFGS